MQSKGQAASEHLMTYGWAILVSMIVGVTLWQMGVFKPVGVTPGIYGFDMIRPTEWSCKADSGSSDILSLVVINAAGGTITNTSLSRGSSSAECTPPSIKAGKITVCTLSDVNCGVDNPSERYEVNVTISYISPGGLARLSAGKIWGPAD